MGTAKYRWFPWDDYALACNKGNKRMTDAKIDELIRVTKEMWIDLKIGLAILAAIGLGILVVVIIGEASYGGH